MAAYRTVAARRALVRALNLSSSSAPSVAASGSAGAAQGTTMSSQALQSHGSLLSRGAACGLDLLHGGSGRRSFSTAEGDGGGKAGVVAVEEAPAGSEGSSSSSSGDVSLPSTEGGDGVAEAQGEGLTDRKEPGPAYIWGKGPRNNLNEMMLDFEDYLDSLPEFPSKEPIYDLPTLLGPEFERDTEFADVMAEEMRLNPALVDAYRSEPETPPYPGARQILRWKQYGVLKSIWGDEEAHPLNKKVACELHMRELQEQTALSDDAVKHIIAICGPRYTPKKGLLRLTSDRYRDREDNRRNIVDIIRALVEEGHARFPNPRKEEDLAAHRAQCAAEAAAAEEAAAAAAAKESTPTVAVEEQTAAKKQAAQ